MYFSCICTQLILINSFQTKHNLQYNIQFLNLGDINVVVLVFVI